MNFDISVENIKCGGCANSIEKKLNSLDLLEVIKVDVETGIVTIDGNESSRNTALLALSSMGYPESGSVEGIKAAAAKAKSFVSCAIGKLDT